MASQHWIITLHWQEGSQLRTRTLEGTVEPDAGATRRSLYLAVVRAATEHFAAIDPAVLFFDMKPDALDG